MERSCIVHYVHQPTLEARDFTPCGVLWGDLRQHRRDEAGDDLAGLLSALAFLPAAGLAGVLGRWLGCAILLFVTFTSLFVHYGGPRRWTWEALDKVAIALWVLYNTIAILQLTSCLAGHAEPGRLVLLVLAVLGAGGTAIFDRWRRVWPVYTREHVRRHAAMHMSGAVGTFLLLVASIGVDWVDEHRSLCWNT
jgi:hypothetical protein